MHGILKSNTLRDRDVKLMAETPIKEFADRSVKVTVAGAETELPADYIVLTLGYKPNTELKEASIPDSNLEYGQLGCFHNRKHPFNQAEGGKLAYLEGRL